MIAYFDVTSPPHIHYQFNFVKNLSSLPWNYGVTHGHILRAPSRTSEWRAGLEIIFPRDEDLAPWEVHAHLEVDPPRALYYRISLNFRTLVILLQVDPAFDDEPKTVCEGYYEIEDTSIFAWSLVLGIGHYRWLRGPICRLPPNSKAYYLVCTIRRILDFL